MAGLVRLSLTQISQRANVVFLLDLSHSVAVAARQQAIDFVRAVSQHKPPQDGIGLVVFGLDAVVEQGVSQQFTLSEVNSQVEGTATNIARAIQVDRQFSSEGARRLVLLSDGNENVGSAAEAALIARSLTCSSFRCRWDGLPRNLRYGLKLIVPAQVHGGMPYRVEAVVVSTIETPASLELFRDGTPTARSHAAAGQKPLSVPAICQC